MWTWHPLKKEIKDWITLKEKEYSKQQNRNPHWTSKVWLYKYIYTDQHEIFYASFPSELYEWISRLVERKNCFKGDEPTVWTPELIQQLKNTTNRISRVVDFWIDSILGGFITEFTVESIVSYNKAKQIFFKIP